MKNENYNWQTDQKLIARANKEAKKLFPKGYNKLQLCAIGKRLFEETIINANTIESDVLLLKMESDNRKRLVEKQELEAKQKVLDRNRFKTEVKEIDGVLFAYAFDFLQFKEIAVDHVLELIDEARDRNDRDVVGMDESINIEFEGVTYCVHVQLWWEKGENWNWEITNLTTKEVLKGWDYL